MKAKILVAGIFFLSLNFAPVASAAEVSLQVPADYKVSQVATLQKAIAFTFDFEGNYIVAEDIGMPASKKRAAINVESVVKVAPDGGTKSLLDRTSQTITNLSFNKGIVYVITRGQIYKIAKGKISDVINGLPTKGDYGNSTVVFADGWMYFAVGTATNSGVVGADNTWLSTYPSVHDVPCRSEKLSGVNVESDNFLSATKDDKANTGSFMPFNTQTSDSVFGMVKCNGAVIKASPDGKILSVYADGLHNPKGLSVDGKGNLWLFDAGMEDRGVRPIKNGKDAFYQLTSGSWYGWPDYSAGLQVDQQAIFSQSPNIPPQPQAVFDLNQIKNLIVSDELFYPNTALAQTADDKLQILNLSSKNLQDFISTNGKIIQYKFGPDHKLYVLVDIADNKTKLFAVEPTTPLAASGSLAATGSKQKRIAINNWMLGLMLTFVSGFGFYAVRNLRYPIKPL